MRTVWLRRSDVRQGGAATGRRKLTGAQREGDGMAELICSASNPAARMPKFADAQRTADGRPRARVRLHRLRTLWFNTGTLCNLACEHCYIESSPRNDRLTYLSRAEARSYLEELAALRVGAEEIGFTGGEPFLNPDLLGMLEDSLASGYRALVLTNAMRPMMKCADALLRLRRRHGERLVLRVSLDHFRQELHERERGRRAWRPAMDGLRWLSANGFVVHVAGRRRWGDEEGDLRRGFQALFEAEGIDLDAQSPEQLVLFPEMDERADTPEISADCWALLGIRAEDLMCASSRMVVKRKGAVQPEVVSCTLLPYQPDFSHGLRLADSLGEVRLNHPHCSRFCVLGGGRCSA